MTEPETHVIYLARHPEYLWDSEQGAQEIAQQFTDWTLPPREVTVEDLGQGNVALHALGGIKGDHAT